jgi:hypothetical protein
VLTSVAQESDVTRIISDSGGDLVTALLSNVQGSILENSFLAQNFG